MCRLPAAESRTDAAAGSSGEQNLESGAAASRARPFAFLADPPQTPDFMEAETSSFQQVGFEYGLLDDIVCFRFEKKKTNNNIALKLKNN